MVFLVTPRYPEPQGFEYTRSLVNAELAPARAAAEALVLPALQQSEVTPALCAARTSSVLSLLDLHRSYFVEQVPEQGGSASMATSAGGLRAPASHPVLRKMKLGPTKAIIPPSWKQMLLCFRLLWLRRRMHQAAHGVKTKLLLLLLWITTQLTLLLSVVVLHALNMGHLPQSLDLCFFVI